MNLLQPYTCGSPGQQQEAATVVERGEDGNSYCYAVRQSLNVPPSGSSECQTHFMLTGRMKKKRVVFETQ
jgi:hypothetical protein